MGGASHTFAFICGLHRSGTSLLHTTLSLHPKISGFKNTGAPEDEGQHLQSVYASGRTFGGPGKFAFSREAYLDESSPLVTPENKQKLFFEWSRYWDTTRPVLLEKSPPNIIRSRFLQAMFPDSAFIFLTRHPVPVAMATQKWANTDLSALIEHWAVAHQAMLNDLPHLKRSIIIRYEDLVEQPQAILDGIYAFLDIPPAPIIETPDKGINRQYFSQWQSSGITRGHEEIAARFGYRFDESYVTDMGLA